VTIACCRYPEDARGVTVYVSEEDFDMDAGGDEVVELEAEASVSPGQPEFDLLRIEHAAADLARGLAGQQPTKAVQIR
jgi:hypothetical protein